MDIPSYRDARTLLKRKEKGEKEAKEKIVQGRRDDGDWSSGEE